MNEPTTCGEGIAANAALPEKIAAVTDAMADVFVLHESALDPADATARPELDAYRQLAADFRDLTEQLRAVAARMTGYRDLPMPAHDEAALSTPHAMQLYERYSTTRRALAAHLHHDVES